MKAQEFIKLYNKKEKQARQQAFKIVRLTAGQYFWYDQRKLWIITQQENKKWLIASVMNNDKYSDYFDTLAELKATLPTK